MYEEAINRTENTIRAVFTYFLSYWSAVTMQSSSPSQPLSDDLIVSDLTPRLDARLLFSLAFLDATKKKHYTSHTIIFDNFLYVLLRGRDPNRSWFMGIIWVWVWVQTQKYPNQNGRLTLLTNMLCLCHCVLHMHTLYYVPLFICVMLRRRGRFFEKLKLDREWKLRT